MKFRSQLRALVVGTTAVATFSLAACAGGSSDSEGAATSGGKASSIPLPLPLPASISKKGAIDVATFYNYPPYTLVKDGKLEGIEPEMVVRSPRNSASNLGFTI